MPAPALESGGGSDEVASSPVPCTLLGWSTLLRLPGCPLRSPEMSGERGRSSAGKSRAGAWCPLVLATNWWLLVPTGTIYKSAREIMSAQNNIEI